jgi:lysophospholipase L1-like esterase
MRWTTGRGAALRGVVVLALLAVLTGCSEPERPGSTPAGADTGQLVTFVGDSWTHGVGATRSRGFPVLTAEILGWDYVELGVSGSGYVVPGVDAPFRSRITAAVAGDPDVIVVQGSLNEQGVDVAELSRAARDTLARLREEADPATEILVVGAPYTPGTNRARIDGVNEAVSGAADAVGLRFVDPAVQNWTDPDDAGLWADPIHPNDAGHRLVAERLAPIIEDLVDG